MQVEGTPPEKYQVEFQLRSLRQDGEQFTFIDRHLVEIFLPRDYPRMAPQCRMLTPVFHPNIAPHAICIGDHWNAGEPLWSMVMRIGEMLAFQSYNTKSPLNGEAARWVDKNVDKLPLDRVPLYVDQPDQPSPAAPAGSQVPTARVVRPASRQASPAQRAAGAAPTARVVKKPTAPATPTGAVPTARVVKPAPKPAAPPKPPPASGGAAPPTVTCKCPGCGATYQVPASMGGKNARCKQCRTIITIPSR